MSDNVAQLSEAMAIMRTKDVQHLINRIKELEAKLSKVMLFVISFAHRARTDEHDKDEMFLLDLSNLRFERDCDITQARTILAELKGDKTQ